MGEAFWQCDVLGHGLLFQQQSYCSLLRAQPCSLRSQRFSVFIKDSFKLCLWALSVWHRCASCTQKSLCLHSLYVHLDIASWYLNVKWLLTLQQWTWAWAASWATAQPRQPCWYEKLGHVCSLIRASSYLSHFSPAEGCTITIWGWVQLWSLESPSKLYCTCV